MYNLYSFTLFIIVLSVCRSFPLDKPAELIVTDPVKTDSGLTAAGHVDNQTTGTVNNVGHDPVNDGHVSGSGVKPEDNQTLSHPNAASPTDINSNDSNAFTDPLLSDSEDKTSNHHDSIPQEARDSLKLDVPNPDSKFNQMETQQMVEMLLKDPILRKRLEQLQGPINEDIAEDARTGCLSTGSRFKTINLDVDHDQLEISQTGTTKKEWRDLKVNRYYGVLRDRFFVQNLESGMVSIQFRRGEPTSAASIKGLEDDWKSEYMLAKCDMYWSMDNNYGAQHAIGMQTYPFELQLVHYNKQYKSIAEASGKKHGILVLSILFEAAGKDSPSLDPLAAAAMMSTFPSDKLHTVHGPLDLKSIFPYDLSNLQYTGAYFSRPCSRQAKWVIFRYPRTISYKQLKKFREVRETAGRRHPGVFLPLVEGEQMENRDVHISRNIRIKLIHKKVLGQGSKVFPILKITYYIIFYFMVLAVA